MNCHFDLFVQKFFIDWSYTTIAFFCMVLGQLGFGDPYKWQCDGLLLSRCSMGLIVCSLARTKTFF